MSFFQTFYWSTTITDSFIIILEIPNFASIPCNWFEFSFPSLELIAFVCQLLIATVQTVNTSPYGINSLLTTIMCVLSSICYNAKLASDWLKQSYSNWTYLQFVIGRSQVQFLTSHKPTYTFWMVWALNSLIKAKELNLSYYLPIIAGRTDNFTPFSRVFSVKWNTNKFVQDLNLGHQFHFLSW